MGRQKKYVRVRGSSGNRGLTSICKIRGVQKTDVAAALCCSIQNVSTIFNNPLRLNCFQVITIAGLLSISPEYLFYIIRFSDHKTENPPEVTTEFEEFKVKFPV